MRKLSCAWLARANDDEWGPTGRCNIRIVPEPAAHGLSFEASRTHPGGGSATWAALPARPGKATEPVEPPYSCSSLDQLSPQTDLQLLRRNAGHRRINRPVM